MTFASPIQKVEEGQPVETLESHPSLDAGGLSSNRFVKQDLATISSLTRYSNNQAQQVTTSGLSGRTMPIDYGKNKHMLKSL